MGYNGRTNDGWGTVYQGLAFLGNAMRQGQAIGTERRRRTEEDGINKAYDYIADKIGSQGDISVLDGDPILNSRHGTQAMGMFMTDRANTETSRQKMLKTMEAANDQLYQNTIRPLAFSAQEAFKAGDMQKFATTASELSAKAPYPYKIMPASDGNFEVAFRSDEAGGWKPTGQRVSPQEVISEINKMMSGEQKILSGIDMQPRPLNSRFLASAARYQMGTILGNAQNLADPQKWIPFTRNGETVYAIPQNRHDNYAVDPSYRIVAEGKGSFMVGSLQELMDQGFVLSPSRGNQAANYQFRTITDEYGNQQIVALDPRTGRRANLGGSSVSGENLTVPGPTSSNYMPHDANKKEPILAIRNKNPGSIRTPDSKGFQAYTSWEDGLQAMSNLLDVYQRKHGLRTVAGIMSRWAPPSENNTPQIIRHVAKVVGVDRNQEINVYDPRIKERLMRGISEIEGSIERKGNGGFTEDQLRSVVYGKTGQDTSLVPQAENTAREPIFTPFEAPRAQSTLPLGKTFDASGQEVQPPARARWNPPLDQRLPDGTLASVQYDKTGKMYRIVGPAKGKEKQKRNYVQEKSWKDELTTNGQGLRSYEGLLPSVGSMREILKDGNIYTGPGADAYRKGARLLSYFSKDAGDTTTNYDILERNLKSLVLEGSKVLKGTLSDSDMLLIEKASSGDISNTPESILTALDVIEYGGKMMEARQEMATQYQEQGLPYAQFIKEWNRYRNAHPYKPQKEASFKPVREMADEEILQELGR